MKFTLNGRPVACDVAPDTTLFDFLRSHGCKSVKCGCETTNCGLCTVWVDEKPVLSCAVPVARVEGRAVTTLEGLQAESAALARCMAEEGAEQCGFCSPGLIMNVLSLARAAHEDPSLVATREDLSRNLSGNLCRCTGYESQLRAIVRYLREDGVAVGFKMPAIEKGALSETEGFTHISTGAPKKDAAALLSGKPVFTADLAPVEALVVKLLRSPHAFAKIRSIDTARPQGPRRGGRLHAPRCAADALYPCRTVLPRAQPV